MINIDTDILLEVLKTYFTAAKYDLTAWISLFNEADEERHLKSAEDMLNKAIALGKVRGLLRCSQGEYVSIKNIHSVSFTWSLEFAADVNNVTLQADIYAFINAVKDTVLTVANNSVNYDVVLTCNQPAAFSSATISGIDYLQVVIGGKCSVTDKSALANSTSIKIDSTAVNGLISYATGYTLSGENYTNSDSLKQLTNQLAYGNTLSLQIHCLKDDAIAKAFRRISTDGSLNLSSGALKTYSIQIDYDDGESAITLNYSLNQAQCAASLGSFVLIDLQFTAV